MKYKLIFFITKASEIVAPLALALAVMTANSTCFFFTYQPEVPNSLQKRCASHRRGV